MLGLSIVKVGMSMIFAETGLERCCSPNGRGYQACGWVVAVFGTLVGAIMGLGYFYRAARTGGTLLAVVLLNFLVMLLAALGVVLCPTQPSGRHQHFYG